MALFSDSTGVNPASLNQLAVVGDGAILGVRLFSMYFRLFNNAGTFQYMLRTRNAVSNGETFFGNIGPTDTPNLTNVGDANVTRTSTGQYIISCSGLTNLFVLAANLELTDVNIKTVQAQTSSGIDINFFIQNSSGAWTDPATSNQVEAHIFGLYK